MNWAHAHLLLNHLPVLGVFFGVAVLVFAALRRSQEGLRIALGTFVLAGLIAIPTYFTGEPAEEVVEHMAGITEASIEMHEEAALLALLAVEGLALISLVGLFLLRGRAGFSVPVAVACLVVALVAGGMLARTANLGGQIHHSEIRAAPPPVQISEDGED